MAAINRVLLLCALAGIAQGYVSGTAKSACENLCSKCGGTGLIKEDMCECRLPADQEADCLKQGLNQDGYLEWSPEPDAMARRRRSIIPKYAVSTNNLPSNSHKRVPRLAQFFDVGYAPSHDMDYDSSDMFRNYRSQNEPGKFEKSNVYEVFIGDDDDESVQLVFPDSNGLEVEHQYIFKGDDGEEHPFASPQTDSQLREKEVDFEDSWSSPNYQLKGQWSNQGANYAKKDWNNRLESNSAKYQTGDLWNYSYNSGGHQNVPQQNGWYMAPYLTNRV